MILALHPLLTQTVKDKNAILLQNDNERENRYFANFSKTVWIQNTLVFNTGAAILSFEIWNLDFTHDLIQGGNIPLHVYIKYYGIFKYKPDATWKF